MFRKYQAVHTSYDSFLTKAKLIDSSLVFYKPKNFLEGKKDIEPIGDLLRFCFVSFENTRRASTCSSEIKLMFFCMVAGLDLIFAVAFLFLHLFSKMKGRGRWVHWNGFIKNIDYSDKNVKIQDIIVPTMDTVRYTYLMELFITHGK